jgi:hypothetical protein
MLAIETTVTERLQLTVTDLASGPWVLSGPDLRHGLDKAATAVANAGLTMPEGGA